MASIADLQAAASDPDLLARFDIAALSQGLPHGWAATNLARLVSASITDGGQQTSVGEPMPVLNSDTSPDDDQREH